MGLEIKERFILVIENDLYLLFIIIIFLSNDSSCFRFYLDISDILSEVSNS